MVDKHLKLLEQKLDVPCTVLVKKQTIDFDQSLDRLLDRLFDLSINRLIDRSFVRSFVRDRAFAGSNDRSIVRAVEYAMVHQLAFAIHLGSVLGSEKIQVAFHFIPFYFVSCNLVRVVTWVVT